jgi:chromosomal replication initiation ATPase DnaA
MAKSKTDTINSKDLQSLIGNFQEALKVYSLKELNDAILSALDQKADNKKEVDFVIQAVSSVYKLTPRLILSKTTRGIVQEARMVTYATLHFDLQMSFRYISARIFKRLNHGSVTQACNQFKQLKPDKFTLDKQTMDRYKEVQKIVYDHIINRKKPTTNENI